MGLSSATRYRVDTSHGPILYLEDITVSFDGFRALNKLSLTIDRGELRCLIGPNGAGKTSLIRIINQITAPDSGSVFFKSQTPLRSPSLISSTTAASMAVLTAMVPGSFMVSPDSNSNDCVPLLKNFNTATLSAVL